MSKDNEILNIKRKKNNFVMIDNRVFENPNISWRAKGLLGYLLSRPDGWEVRVSDLVKRSIDGKTAIYSTLRELKKHGYYNKIPVRNEKGVIIKWSSYIYEEPIIIDINDYGDRESSELCHLKEEFENNINDENGLKSVSQPLTENLKVAVSSEAKTPHVDSLKMGNLDMDSREHNNTYINNTDSNKTTTTPKGSFQKKESASQVVVVDTYAINELISKHLNPKKPLSEFQLSKIGRTKGFSFGRLEDILKVAKRQKIVSVVGYLVKAIENPDFDFSTVEAAGVANGATKSKSRSKIVNYKGREWDYKKLAELNDALIAEQFEMTPEEQEEWDREQAEHLKRLDERKAKEGD